MPAYNIWESEKFLFDMSPDSGRVETLFQVGFSDASDAVDGGAGIDKALVAVPSAQVSIARDGALWEIITDGHKDTLDSIE